MFERLSANRLFSCGATIALLACWACLQAAPASAAGPDAQARTRKLLEDSGVRGGLVVQIGCADPRIPAALHANASYLVHALDTDATRVRSARRYVSAQGLYGPVSAETFDGRHLPYVDNLVSMVVADDLGSVPMKEVMRVLAPGGVAMIAGKKTVKPRPADIDEWTHFLHDASGNAVAADKEVGSPRGLRWTAGPPRSRDHDALASMSAMTTSDGRVFYILDEGATSLIHRPARWRLIGRDAFNGVLLWKRDIPRWLTHLWNFRAGPVQLTRRLVSVGDRVYVTLGIAAPVSELDAATGRTIRVFDGSAGTEELICHRGTLLTVIGNPELLDRDATKVSGYWDILLDRKPPRKSIVAYQAETGKRLWTKTGENVNHITPLSLVACGDKVFYLDSDNLHCLALADGRELWHAPFATKGQFFTDYAPTIVAYRDVILCMTWDRLWTFSADDGRVLWKQKGSMGLASPGDLFAIDGLAWCVPTTAAVWNGDVRDRRGKIVSGKTIPTEDFLGNKGKDIWAMDVHTGEVKRDIPRSSVLPGGHHHRCYRNKATDRFLICGRRGLEYVDLDGEKNVNNWWTRGICQYGIMPANGMTYVPPDPCQCFKQLRVNSFLALTAGSALDGADKTSGPAFQQGPAAAETVAAPAAKTPAASDEPASKSRLWHAPVWPAKADEWPTYRGNVTRSGSTQTSVPTKLTELWRADVGGELTAPTAAGGKLLVCKKGGLTVECLDAATGQRIWSFVTGGRLDSPPTFAGPFCVLGCGDGWVYCLRADDGKMVWRYRAAPAERRIVADSRVESAWPVNTGVLVLDGVAYVAAGRSTYLDGGIRLVGLDIATGKVICETSDTTSPGPLGKNGPPAGGAMPDLLVSDGTNLNMRHVLFDRQLQTQPGRPDTLYASTGLLDDSWAHREPWQLGRSRCRAASGAKLVAFDADNAYGVINPYTYLKKTPAMWPPSHDGHFHQKYSRYKTGEFPIGTWIVKGDCKPPAPAPKPKAKTKGRSRPKTPADLWCVEEPIQPRAMVLAGKTLFLAGWKDAVEIHEETGQPLDAKTPDPHPAFLSARSTADGHELANYPLDAEPVFDGLIAAYGKLYVSMKDGTVRCFGKAANK